ncbi:MAG TPA: hypothetical protein EYN00_07410 [Planctomycetes bacterium]|nr:hypothetical protein [Planctomycetota bacterium]
MQRSETFHDNKLSLDVKTYRNLEGIFQRGLFETAISLEPENLECLVGLGDLYAREESYRESNTIDQKLVELCPEEPRFQYNLACSSSLLGEIKEGLLALEKALELGFDDLDLILRDQDLDSVRETDEFFDLLARFSDE